MNIHLSYLTKKKKNFTLSFFPLSHLFWGFNQIEFSTCSKVLGIGIQSCKRAVSVASSSTHETVSQMKKKITHETSPF